MPSKQNNQSCIPREVNHWLLTMPFCNFSRRPLEETKLIAKLGIPLMQESLSARYIPISINGTDTLIHSQSFYYMFRF